MIIKGVTNNNGARLAAYLTRGKDGERAELWQMAGFGAKDIREAFQDIHVMADATKCEKPFMHVQARGPQSDRVLTRQEWNHVANKIEEALKLDGQPRAIAFHTDLKTNQEHMHVVWSRIREDLRAQPMPYFKYKLKEVARQLEFDLNLERVSSRREGPIRAPKRYEEEQARRLGNDVHEIRRIIRDCWERSDDSASFQVALRENNFVIVRGDRRDFVVLDENGGAHALGKRTLGVNADEIRARMADLNHHRMPTIAEARKQIREREASMPVRALDFSFGHQDPAGRSTTAKKWRIEKSGSRDRLAEQVAIGKEQEGRAYGAGRAKSGFRKPSRIAGKTMDAVASTFESLFAPVTTPEQRREAAESAREREANGNKTVSLSRFLAERQKERDQEQAQESERQRQRDRGGREI